MLDPTVYKDWQIAEDAEKNLPILSIGAVGNDLESIFIRLVDRSDRETQTK